ncbi:MAG: HAD domain-containing protein [Gammaproteobacteria bacterium]|nr:HAD domain-containing protein [Gammaproteobacteria bacterium]
MYIFLDFDGVLRRLTATPACFEAELLENFESVLRPVSEAELVISSTWRLEMSLSELRRLFSPDISERIVGVTPETLALTPHSRYYEVRIYLKSAKSQETPWLAIDDDPANTLRTHPC